MTDTAVRDRAIAALDTLEAGRDRVAAAGLDADAAGRRAWAPWNTTSPN